MLFNGSTSDVNFGSDATLDDLADNAFTAEAWIRASGPGESNAGRIFEKAGSASLGWFFTVQATDGLVAFIYCTPTRAETRISLSEFAIDDEWHHVAMFFDDAGDRKIYFAIDGVWVTSYSQQTAGVGAIVTDINEDLYLGNQSSNDRTFDGFFGWSRISDNDRHNHGSDFTPPARDAPPSVDVNTIEQWNTDEGLGTTLTASVNSPANDGTMTNITWVKS